MSTFNEPMSIASASSGSPVPQPWLTPWPTEDLESVSRCPMCHATARSVWHEQLVDTTFRVAPGYWRLWRCESCAGAYLDPRPTTLSISRAYSSYYTHTPIEPELLDAVQPLSKRLRTALNNGYVNWRFGAHRAPSTALGILVLATLPVNRQSLDRQYRALPRLGSWPKRLLDVGCGNGDFLQLAASVGWEVEGVEPDPVAAQAAYSPGLQVHVGGLEMLNRYESRYDAITLSHVIEHVHEPLQTLEQCFRLLKPGGSLWLETPNVLSSGHELFGEHWRGLEAPRHLSLFSSQGLRQSLRRVGYVQVKNLRIPSPRKSMYLQSWAAARSALSEPVTHLPPDLAWRTKIGNIMDYLRPAASEFLTMHACKPRE